MKVAPRKDDGQLRQTVRSWDRVSGASRSTSGKPSSSTKVQNEISASRSQSFEPKKGLGRKPSKKWLAFLKKQEGNHDRIKDDAKQYG